MPSKGLWRRWEDRIRHAQNSADLPYLPHPCTRNSFDLYWIAVHPERHRKGPGCRLVTKTGTLIRKPGGHRIYVDTSRRDKYASTRAFYESCGYRLEAVLKDFYASHDGQAIYCKVLS